MMIRFMQVQLFTVVIVAMLVDGLCAQSSHRLLRDGDLYYDQGEFLVAEEAYRKAQAGERNPQAIYNLGNAIYQQERYEEAVRHFEAAAEQATDAQVRAKAFHNLGNAHYRAQALDKSIEAYKNALRLNPGDIDTKRNLTLALQSLQQQQQQQQQQSQQEPDDSEQDQQQQQQQSPGESGDTDDNTQQQTARGEDPADDEGDRPDAPESERPLTREEAEELLRIIDTEDSRVQQNLRRSSADERRPKKDW